MDSTLRFFSIDISEISFFFEFESETIFSDTLLSKSLCYRGIGEPEKALETANIVLSLINTNHDIANKGRAYREVGTVNLLTRQYETAEQAFAISLQSPRLS